MSRRLGMLENYSGVDILGSPLELLGRGEKLVAVPPLDATMSHTPKIRGPASRQSSANVSPKVARLSVLDI